MTTAWTTGSPPADAPRRRVLAMLAVVLVTGCGYSIRPPYEPTVRTVYVPVFRSVSFEREVNLQLTQLVQEEIRTRTPFKVVGRPEGADTTLEGTITFVDRNAIVENPNNLPRQILGNMNVMVRWVDNRTSQESVRSFDAPEVPVSENLPFFPELGETTQLGHFKIMKNLARDIVNMMEEPW